MKASLPGGFFFANFKIMNSLAFIAIVTLGELRRFVLFKKVIHFLEVIQFICVELFIGFPYHSWASLVIQMVKNLPAMQKTWAPSLGQEDLLEKGMATHSKILAWRIPWTEETCGLQSIGLQKVGND